MLRFAIRRLVYTVVAIIVTTVVVFTLSRLAGDPRLLYLTAHVTQEQWDAWGKRMGLDKPLIVQYLVWLSRAARGDLGESLQTGHPTARMVMERIPATLQLSLSAFAFVLITGVPLGVLSAVKRSTVWDYIGRTFAVFGQALPPFWLGIMLILLFSVHLGWLPTSQRGGIDHYIMPSVTLGWIAAAGMLRLVRSAMLETLDSEFIKFARAKGVSNTRIIWKHGLRNAVIPPLTYAGLLLAGFLAGTVVTETVFAWPGLGKLAVTAVFHNDFPVMTSVVLLFTMLYLGVTLVVDVTYAFLDPRIRYG
jgi:peptide/nickel transport system permease protein